MMHQKRFRLRPIFRHIGKSILNQRDDHREQIDCPERNAEHLPHRKQNSRIAQHVKRIMPAVHPVRAKSNVLCNLLSLHLVSVVLSVHDVTLLHYTVIASKTACTVLFSHYIIFVLLFYTVPAR